jgi:hypothetical protein
MVQYTSLVVMQHILGEAPWDKQKTKINHGGKTNKQMKSELHTFYSQTVLLYLSIPKSTNENMQMIQSETMIKKIYCFSHKSEHWGDSIK